MGLETLGVRTLASFIFAPVILLSAWFGGLFFFLVVVVIAALGMYEFFNLARKKGSSPQFFAGCAGGALLLVLIYDSGLRHVTSLLIAIFMLVAIIELYRAAENPLLNIATTLAGLFYVPLSFGFLLMIRQISLPGAATSTLGAKLVILLFASIWICDSGAYILGAKLGRHKLFPRISPNKTIEGTFAGLLLAAVLAGVAQRFFLTEISMRDALIIGGICGTLGQVSDLVESLLKRDAQVKDSSNLIPGHGGILDRFDSEILVAPAVFFYLQYAVAFQS